jgi:uncharacterized protein
MKTEFRSTTVALRAAPDNKFEIAGIAASYGQLSADLGGFREIIAPGAFTRSLAANPDVVATYNHDVSKVLGRTTSGTLVLSDSPQGLRFVCKLDPNQQLHRDLHASVKRGDTNACSFAFSLDGDAGDKFDEASVGGQRFTRRTLRAVKLHDVSVVTYAAYPTGTHVDARSKNIIRRAEKSLDQRFFEATGREIRRERPARRSGETLEQRLARQAEEIRKDAHALRFGTGFMSAAEKEYFARQFEARTGIEIKTYF